MLDRPCNPGETLGSCLQSRLDPSLTGAQSRTSEECIGGLGIIPPPAHPSPAALKLSKPYVLCSLPIAPQLGDQQTATSAAPSCFLQGYLLDFPAAAACVMPAPAASHFTCASPQASHAGYIRAKAWHADLRSPPWAASWLRPCKNPNASTGRHFNLLK